MATPTGTSTPAPTPEVSADFCTPGPDPAAKWKMYGYGQGAWYYNTTSGEITHATGLQKVINQLGPGFSLSGPFPTQAQALAFKARCPPNSPVGKAVGGVLSVGDFLRGLTSKGLWIRIAEVLIGGAMIIIGLAQLAGSSKSLQNVKVLPV